MASITIMNNYPQTRRQTRSMTQIQTTLGDLPDDILSVICGKLDSYSLLTYSRVSLITCRLSFLFTQPVLFRI